MANFLADFDVRDGLDPAIIRKLNNNFHFLLDGGSPSGGSTSPITSSSVMPYNRTDEVLWYNEDESMLYVWTEHVDEVTGEVIGEWQPIDVANIHEEIERLDTAVTAVAETVVDLGERVAKLEEGQKVLWSGASMLLDTDTITLDETVSDQKNGIVLAFSGYDAVTDEPINDDWHVEFIPKHPLILATFGAIDINMHTTDFMYFGSKSVSVFDDHIVGSVKNISTGIQSGVDFDNSHWCLRYVFGV